MIFATDSEEGRCETHCPPPQPHATLSQMDIIEHILPEGEVSILAGSSGAGKSTLLMQFLSAFQAGEEHFLGHALKLDTRWGYLANDHAWKLYEETARRCRLDINALPHISLMDDDSIDLEVFKAEPLRLLEQLLTRLVQQGCTAVVVDTLVSWFGGDIRNYNIPAYALLRLGRYCRHNGITLLGTHHATKARTDYTFSRAQDRISGSAALLGFSSTQLCLIPPDESKEAAYQFHIISHNAKAKVIALTRASEEEGGIFHPFTAAEGGRLGEVEERIMEAFSQEAEGVALSRQALAAKLGGDISLSTLDRHLKVLLAAGLVARARHGEYRKAVV